MKKNLFFLPFLALLFIVFTASAEVKLPAVFCDNMILQQQTEVAVWGWAKPNAGVKVSGSWNGKSYTAKADANGYWKVKMQTPAGGFTPYTLSVTEGKTVTLKNVLIGEVWLCSGQSNMEMPMKGFTGQPIEGGPEAIADSRNSSIRMFTVKRSSQLHPQDDCEGSWQEASPVTTPGFSATAYYFGRMLYKTLNIPVGLLHSSWGGSRIEAWMDPDALQDIPEKPLPQKEEDIKVANGTPTVLFNGMIKPVLGYGIRGAIWYQGESNRQEPDLYVKMFDRMVTNWRKLWNVGEFPFYYCQIAPFNYAGWGKITHSGYIREAQAKCMEITPNTGMAVLMDADSPDCIHPPKKKDAGERLAFWALAKTYGMEGMSYKSPELQNMQIEGRMVTLTFDIPGAPGLTSHGKDIKNFFIGNKQGGFYKAVAAISGNKVFLFSPAVSEPVSVRYCFDDTSGSEIFAVDSNLPVASFRTDQ